MLPTALLLPFDQRQKRSLIQDVIPFSNNIIIQYTNPLSFETEPQIIYTIPLMREHCDSYIFYIRYKTFDITLLQTSFQIIFNPVHGIKTGILYRTIHPQKLMIQMYYKFM